MKHSNYKLFANLLESILLEASTAIDMVKLNPGGREIAEFLHRKSALGHDVDWEIVKKIPWSELKGSRWSRGGGGWIILIGQNGTGAIRASGGDYSVSASNGKPAAPAQDTGWDPNRFFSKSVGAGGRAIELIKGVTGPIRSYAISMDRGEVARKREKRKDLHRAAVKQGGKEILSTEDAQASAEAMLMRFKPLWIKMITQAMADIKGFVGLQVKNHAFAKVKPKLERLQRLDVILDLLQSKTADDDDDHDPNAINDYLKTSIYHAVDLTARHYYPDQVSDRQTFGNRYSSSASEGVKRVLTDISKGDTRKLGTVLGFFKRTLLTS